MTNKEKAAVLRHPLDWENPDFYDEKKLDEELRRVFDICHGCRRCFNLCDSFPRLFDLIDGSELEEVSALESRDFEPVVEACTLCDMCFSNKCPYVPPHEFNLDFPHLMLRHRVVQRHKQGGSFTADQLAKTDRNGSLGSFLAPLANWAIEPTNKLTRPLLEKVAGIDHRAQLPQFESPTLMKRAETQKAPPLNPQAPAYGRKVALYATCFMNYNSPHLGWMAREILAHNGVETLLFYPECCGMPQLEQGDVAQVAGRAQRVAAAASPLIDQGYDIVALVPSCALMLKSEWPLLAPENEEIHKLARATQDITQYLVGLSKDPGLTPGLKPIEGGVMLHIPCHSRAQNMGRKAEEMVRLIPGLQVQVMERCSGHGGIWGTQKENFQVALKVGAPVINQIRKQKDQMAYMTSECPLAGIHLRQGVDLAEGDEAGSTPRLLGHPLQLLAMAYGLGEGSDSEE
jgi:glycerol-3-phosphate dehydrogenase subunit C